MFTRKQIELEFIFGIQLRFNDHFECAWLKSIYSKDLVQHIPLSRHIPHRCDSMFMTKWPQGIMCSQRGLLCNDTGLQWGAQISPSWNCKPCHLITGTRTKRSDWTHVICCGRWFLYMSSLVVTLSPEDFTVSHMLRCNVKTSNKAGHEKCVGENECFSPKGVAVIYLKRPNNTCFFLF